MPGLTLDRLRAATRADHQDLEDRLDIFGRIATPQGRRDLVAGFHRLHAGVEAAIAPWVDDLPDLDFAARRRSSRLAADLAALGEPTPPARSAPVVRSRGTALGLMYVLEGSTLGGRVIRKRAVADGVDLTGLSFLDAYGEAAGERWRSFLAVLERETATPAEREAAVRGGVAGFRHAAICLGVSAMAAS